MIWMYKIPGIIAGVALVFYAALELVLLNAFDMTLTLPGIAGVILSIGMAVDANVIIYARIREEIAAGKTVRSAIDIGFKKALTAIIDGNVTTLIAAIVLNFMAPVLSKGFAQTLGLGIIISMIHSLHHLQTDGQCGLRAGHEGREVFRQGQGSQNDRFRRPQKDFLCDRNHCDSGGTGFHDDQQGRRKGALNLSMEFRGGTSTDVTFNEGLHH